MIANEVLNKALNSDALAEIMSKYSDNGLVKFLVNSGAARDASHSMVRPENVDGAEYLLCPVLNLFDEELNNEVGFAVSVDEDHFDVYAYEHNYDNGKSKVFSKLPHCVHKAIVLEGSDYSQISDEVKITANIDSAILFINNYLTDQAVGLDSPVEFFDNKLYQQLINRLTSSGNNKVIKLRLETLLKNYETLDEDDAMYENNLERANIHLINFLFGCEDNISNQGLLQKIETEPIKPHIQQLYNSLIQNGWMYNAKELEEWSNIQPHFNKNIIQKAYKNLIQNGFIKYAKELKEWTNIQPPENIIQKEYEKLIQKGWIGNAKQLNEWTNIQPDKNIIQKEYEKLIQNRMIEDAKKLYEWTNIQPPENIIQTGYEKLIQKGWINDAKHLSEWTNIPPKESVIQTAYDNLIQHGAIGDAKELYEWSELFFHNKN